MPLDPVFSVENLQHRLLIGIPVGVEQNLVLPQGLIRSHDRIVVIQRDKNQVVDGIHDLCERTGRLTVHQESVPLTHRRKGQIGIAALLCNRKLLLLLQIPYCVKELVGCRRILLVGIHHKIVGIPGL